MNCTPNQNKSPRQGKKKNKTKQISYECILNLLLHLQLGDFAGALMVSRIQWPTPKELAPSSSAIIPHYIRYSLKSTSMKMLQDKSSLQEAGLPMGWSSLGITPKTNLAELEVEPSGTPFLDFYLQRQHTASLQKSQGEKVANGWRREMEKEPWGYPANLMAARTGCLSQAFLCALHQPAFAWQGSFQAHGHFRGVQRRLRKMIWGMAHISCEERLRKLACFQPRTGDWGVT